ncbi:MAG TPA: DUF4136 domain-containing protein [Sphingomonas sp.]|nr:DUF4136 domain-containing protein [Sphingomonas sp.]
MSTLALRPLRLLALAPALALAACATSGNRPVEVTRFHLAQPIAPGSFAIENVSVGPQGAPLAPDSLELQDYNSIIADQLTRLGFTRAPDISHAELTVTVDVERGTRQAYRSGGSSVSLGLGGSSFGRHSGFGLGGGVSFPIGKQPSRYVVGTMLRVQIKRRSEGTVIWEGRARTEARASDPAAQPQAAVARLANALFTGFPGESGRTITVR